MKRAPFKYHPKSSVVQLQVKMKIERFDHLEETFSKYIFHSRFYRQTYLQFRIHFKFQTSFCIDNIFSLLIPIILFMKLISSWEEQKVLSFLLLDSMRVFNNSFNRLQHAFCPFYSCSITLSQFRSLNIYLKLHINLKGHFTSQIKIIVSHQQFYQLSSRVSIQCNHNI